jgi:predicted ester cyclase
MMSTASSKTVVRRYLEALSAGDKSPEVVRKYVSDEALIQHIATIEAGFPRYELSAEDMIAEDDRVVLRATFRGTHQGEFAGIAPTGRHVTQSFIIIYRVDGEKIAEHWIGMDMMSFMQQLGGVPEAATH